MTDWTDGYVADIGYTFGYYNELNPLRIRLAFLNAGLVFPEVGTACELGFGQGVSANFHAATSMVEWHGTDFNPSQAAVAQEMARASGASAHLHDAAFADFCNRSDLPDFDFICLHGIWSWISDENRHTIVDFIRRKLKVGGVAYISYNTQPGWAAMVPMRHLLTLHSDLMGASAQGIVPRIDAALAFAEKMMAANPGFAKANPLVGAKLDKLRGQNRNYLAHEYFNRDWMPMPFATMAQWLAPAKVGFACSATYQEHVDGINLTPEQKAVVQEIGNTTFRESVRDFMVNQQFRRDYWVKGVRTLTPLEQTEQLRAQRVALVLPRAEVPSKAVTAAGEATLQEAVYGPILEVLAGQPVVTLGEIEAQVAHRKLGLGHVAQAALVLGGMGALAPANDEHTARLVAERTRKLNHYLCNQARSRQEIACLASPVTGGGVAVSRFRQMFLQAMGQGRKTPEEWAQYAWSLAAAQGGKINNKDGVPLETAEENLAEMTNRARDFAVSQLPVLKGLGIAL